MTIRLDMLKAASQARGLLGDSAACVIDYLRAQINPDGGFRGRSNHSDLYYTVFGTEALIALGRPPEVGPLAGYLERFGDGSGLDFVHLACLARSLADLSEIAGEPVEPGIRQAILRRIESHRSGDGGYNSSIAAPQASAYPCFLALGVYQDLDAEIPSPAALAHSMMTLKTPQGGYANHPSIPVPATPATAAAIATRHYLGLPIEHDAADWLLGRVHRQGGFLPTSLTGDRAEPDLLSTATAIHALALAAVPLDQIKASCLNFIHSLRTEQGGYCAGPADKICDCEYTYYALLALGHLAGGSHDRENPPAPGEYR